MAEDKGRKIGPDDPVKTPRQYLQRGKARLGLFAYQAAIEDFEVAVQAEKVAMAARRYRARANFGLCRMAQVVDDLRMLQDAGERIGNRDLRAYADALSQTAGEAEANALLGVWTPTLLPPEECADGPTIVMATAPKTGSTSLSHALGAAIDAPVTNLLCYRGRDTVYSKLSDRAVQAFAGKGVVNHGHLNSDAATLDLLRDTPSVRIVLHLRDPRETLLSTADMCLRLRTSYSFATAPVPDPAHGVAFLDWMVDHYTPQLLTWMHDWITAYDTGHPSIVSLSTLDDLKSKGQDSVARHIAEKLGVTDIQTVKTQPRRTGQRLEGSQKLAYSDAQLARLEAQLPQALMQRFDWGPLAPSGA